MSYKVDLLIDLAFSFLLRFLVNNSIVLLCCGGCCSVVGIVVATTDSYIGINIINIMGISERLLPPKVVEFHTTEPPPPPSAPSLPFRAEYKNAKWPP
jgi:hypothetical protein